MHFCLLFLVCFIHFAILHIFVISSDKVGNPVLGTLLLLPRYWQEVKKIQEMSWKENQDPKHCKLARIYSTWKKVCFNLYFTAIVIIFMPFPFIFFRNLEVCRYSDSFQRSREFVPIFVERFCTDSITFRTSSLNYDH